MKKGFILFLIIFLNTTLFAQKSSDAIVQSKQLIKERKYDSAFKVLETADPDNKNAEVVLLKEDIALNYFVSSLMHQMFALKDLEKKESIEMLRGSNGNFSMHSFAINDVLDSLIVKDPNNCKLNQGLGKFYYEVHLKYGDEWLKKEDELDDLIEKNYQKAIDGHCEDDLSYYAVGMLKLTKKNYKESVAYFLKSIELNKVNADAFYNLGYAYLYCEKPDSALIYSKKSFEMYTDSSYKSDAARMMGEINFEQEEDSMAIECYELADRFEAMNYYTLKALLNLYVKSKNPKTAATRLQFFMLNPANPTIYNDLDDIYYQNKKQQELIDFYKEQVLKSDQPKKVTGSLYFYLAQSVVYTDKRQAKEYFLKSKEVFSEIYKPDHQVFKAIEDGLKMTE